MKILYLTIILFLAGCIKPIETLTNTELLARLEYSHSQEIYTIKTLQALSKRPLNDEQKILLARKLPELLSSNTTIAIKQQAIKLSLGLYPNKICDWLGDSILAGNLDQPSAQLYLATLADIGDDKILPTLIVSASPDKYHFSYGPNYLPAIHFLYGQTIEKIAARPLNDVLVDVILARLKISDQSAIEDRQVRLSALFWLLHSQGRCLTVQQLKGQPGIENDFVILAYWLENFAYLPANIKQYQTMSNLLNELNSEDLVELKNIYENFKALGYDFELCDTALLLSESKEIQNSDTGLLIAEINRKLSSLNTRPRHPTSTEDFASQYHLLSLPDLLRINILLDWLPQHNNQLQIAEILIDDFADKSTEHGGLFFLNNQNLRLSLYQPETFLSNYAFVESNELKKDAILSFARWHSHASNRSDNYAGPGSDDIKYITYVRTPMVIITLLNYTNIVHFNIDYVNIDNVVIDLGIYQVQPEKK